ncbi:hypothetical protein [Brevibacillus marinus]|uniref:hypothetical protein n=1 Tax=Brevibacillus marinus TaxID=2496837 RepID=UPI000F83ABEA|nr:hypothetical protein [Brevibacillus marinus]
MANLWSFFDKMNLFVWVLALFAAHLLLYLLLGTDTWLTTSLLAAAVYAVALLLLKIVARRFVEGEKKDSVE